MSLIQRLKALADENRLKIIRMLIDSDLCVGALAQRLGISKPAVSQHLQVLRKAGVVNGEKRGYWTHYMVDRKVMREIAEAIHAIPADGKLNPTPCWRITGAPTPTSKPKEVTMCQNCQQPIKLQDKPEKCSPEQIRQCHGDVKDHPCTQKETDRKK
jgi:ArsR family transcriptional regulator, arsenate/arsenite/antimonite-responsive transcriptional repressor